MTNYELTNIDSEDIEDLLIKVESSFDIKFEVNELAHISTFGKLCDHITDKIQLESSEDCTTQQAFYKLRDAISSTLKIDSKTISTNSLLSELLPRDKRQVNTKKLENYLTFELNLLRPPHWVTWTLAFSILASFIGLFSNWLIGLVGITFSIGGLRLAKQMGNELEVSTVGELAKKMAQENYLKSRRDSKTFNKNEIERTLRDWFSDYLSLDKSKLTRNATFV